MAIAAGQRVTAAMLNPLQNPPNASMTQTSTLTSLANNGWTSVGLDTTVFDNYLGHNNGVNNSRYTVQLAGNYLVLGAVSFTANASGNRGARIAKNGTPYQGSGTLDIAITALPTSMTTVPVIIALAVGDYVEVQGFQSSGGSLNTQIGADGTTSQLTVTRTSS